MSDLRVTNLRGRTSGTAPSLPDGAVVTGVITATQFSGNIVGVSATFTGNVSVAGTLTYEDVTNIDSVGLVTARTGVRVNAGGLVVTGVSTFNNEIRIDGVIETVATATTYMSGSAMVLEMDTREATTYTYTIPTGSNIGIVSFKNVPAQTSNPSGTSITLIVAQNAAGTGNTTAQTGIGTNCTIVGYENGAPVSGISTRGLVGSGTTVTLSTTGGDENFISFFIRYTGGTNTVASSYKVYVVNSDGFRQGTIGV